MNDQLLTWLLSTGLDEQRARIYLLALSQGEARAKEIADVLHIGRTAVYDNLRVLEQRGYVKTIHEGKRKVFVPLHPKELYKKFNQQVDQLKDLLPDFLALYAEKGQQPFVQLFAGQYAAREVYEDILRVAKKEYHYFSAQQRTAQMVDTAYMKKWVTRRVQKGIESYSLRPSNTDVPNEAIFTEETRYLRHVRYLPAYVDLRSTIYIYENNVAVISTTREQTASITYSSDMANTFRSIFQLLWGIGTKS